MNPQTETQCPFCSRELEDPKELEDGLCSSDDCPRHTIAFNLIEFNHTTKERFTLNKSPLTFREAKERAKQRAPHTQNKLYLQEVKQP